MLLKNTKPVGISPSSVGSSDIRIRNGRITETGKKLRPERGEEVHDLSGRIVMPGFINAHTHLYSALARGMGGPKERPGNFIEILQKIWWKLDLALDEDAVYYSTLVGAIDAARCGTTTLIDHHASPNAISGSLDAIREAMSEVGIRGILCYEVTDRGGMKKRDQGLKENERFISENRKNPMFRGMVGAHAAFTLSDKSLRLLGEAAEEHGTGVHIHVAEDKSDVTDAEENYGSSVTDRLAAAGVLRKNSIFVHGVHLKGDECRRAVNAGAWLIHNPRSNMNNSVGYAPLHMFGERGGLGTDGFPPDMFEEAKAAFFKQQDEKRFGKPFGGEKDAGGADIPFLIQNGQKLVSGIFGQKFGKLAAGSPADLVIIDYMPPTPMNGKNGAGHFLFGMNSSMVESVMVGGKWVVKNRVVVGIDLASVYEKSSAVAEKLWEKMESM